MKKIKIVYLYSVLAGYVESILKGLVEKNNVEDIEVIHWLPKGINSTCYELPHIEGVNFYERSRFDDFSLLEFLKSHKPNIIYVSGWMDKGYLKAIKHYRVQGYECNVVCGIDDQWKGSFRQLVGQYYFRIFYRSIFDYMWVAGKPQYLYARKFGYKDNQIIYNLLSAEPHFFNAKTNACKRFVFVGRLDPVKGIDTLIQAYSLLSENEKNEWPLIIIGTGEMESLIKSSNVSSIIHIPFLQRDALVGELMKGGVGCLPSSHEQWGVVIHEFTAMGMPLLLSDECGAASEFLINDANGYSFESNNVISLSEKMKSFISMSNSQFELMSNKSKSLSKRITPELTIDSLLSIYREKHN
ncbi:glycosyltransferase family 1 protein [Parashewanella curva]|uniref:Glycosyltransferase family 1 protein n=1 Tax=Parashewanella curva TaxID=2338552 RepID=A0A3L8Q030_9GAMM|nr:glycosyltransferase [Parashewanella curva]RLV60389.1 glycosyltransferase family 1 protein [Parashewanella curva]